MLPMGKGIKGHVGWIGNYLKVLRNESSWF